MAPTTDKNTLPPPGPIWPELRNIRGCDIYRHPRENDSQANGQAIGLSRFRAAMELVYELMNLGDKEIGHRQRYFNPMPNPISLSRRALETGMVTARSHYFTHKPDGLRVTLLLFTTPSLKFEAACFDRSLRFYEMSVLAQPEFFRGTLIDGELVWENDPSMPDGRRIVFLAFALYAHRGNSITHLPLLEMQALLRNIIPLERVCGTPIAVDACERRMASQGRIVLRSLPLTLGSDKEALLGACAPRYALSAPIKPIVPPEELVELASMLDGGFPHPVDGLVLYPLDEGVKPLATSNRLFKWKNGSHTIDLQLRARLNRPVNPSSLKAWKFSLHYLDANFTVRQTVRDTLVKPAVVSGCHHDDDDEGFPIDPELCDDDNDDEEKKTMDGQEKPVARYRDAYDDFLTDDGQRIRFMLDLLDRSTQKSLREWIDRALKARALGFVCIVECQISKSELPDTVLCAVRYLREKPHANNHFTLQQTHADMIENISLRELCAAVGQTLE